MNTFLATAGLLLLAAANISQQASFENAKTPLEEKNATTLNFTANTEKIQSGVPFLASCHISNFAEHAKRNYSVVFYRSKCLECRERLATYKLTVKPSGVQSLIFDTRSPDYWFEATPGKHFDYPTFDVRIMTRPDDGESVSLLKNYWCELQDEAAEEQLAVSNLWINTPIVRLAISGPLASDPTNKTFTASCHVHFLEKRIVKGPEYQVKLLLADSANFAVYRYYALATFKVPTVRPTMFLRNDSYLGRTVLKEGDHDALPIFEFNYRVLGTKKDYFSCRVEDPESDWKQVIANKVLHL